MNHNDPPVARCFGLSWLFESIDKRDHKEAKKLCHGTDGQLRCPLFDACEANMNDLLNSRWRSGIEGTWAGRHFGARNRPGRPRKDSAA